MAKPAKEALDLDALGSQYEIIGELPRAPHLRTLLARRRSDGTDVLIRVATKPEGDAGNAISHLAADGKRLTELSQRNLAPVLDVQWVGADALAVITRRVNAPTLEEMLTRREEDFSFPRIATLLQEINGVLEWARAQKVVHRTVSLETIYVEPGSDRVLVSFVPAALSHDGIPDASDDARQIASLARAMFVRAPAAPERASIPLIEARPGLPALVIEQTEAFLADKPAGALPDVNGYIGSIAMADAIKRSETECAETARKLIEEERVTRDELEARRQQCEREIAEQQRQFTAKKEQYEAELARDRRELEDLRAKLEKQATLLAAERAEFERASREAAERLEWDRAALDTQARQYAQMPQAPAVAEDERSVLENETLPDAAPQEAAPRDKFRVPILRGDSRKLWSVAGVVAALVLVVTAVSLGVQRRDRTPDQRVGASPSPSPAAAYSPLVVDSVAGALAVDSVQLTGPEEEPVQRRPRRAAPVEETARAPDTDPPTAAPTIPLDSLPSRDTLRMLPTPPLPPPARVDTLIAPTPDPSVVPRPDTFIVPRPDTAPRFIPLPPPDPDSIPGR